MTSEQPVHRAISYKVFDRKRVIFEDVRKVELKDKKLSYYISNIRYKHPDGKIGYLLLNGPSGYCALGVTKQWPMSVDEEKRTDDNISGYNAPNSIISPKELKDGNYREESVEFMRICDELREDVRTFALSEKQKSQVPAAPMICIKLGIEGVKQLYSPTKTIVDKKTKEEKTIGPQLWPALMWNQKEKTFKTIVVSPTGEQVSPLKYIETAGTIEPVYWAKQIYFGSHGVEKPIGASIKLHVWACNYYPRGSSMPTPSADILPPIKKQIESQPEHDDDQTHDEDYGDYDAEPPASYDPNAKLGDGNDDDSAPQTDEPKTAPKTVVKKRTPVRRKPVEKN